MGMSRAILKAGLLYDISFAIEYAMDMQIASQTPRHASSLFLNLTYRAQMRYHILSLLRGAHLTMESTRNRSY